MKYLLGSLVALGLLFGIKTYSAPPSDEETLVSLENEWSKCSNFTQKDADCFKAVIGPQLVVLLPNGILMEYTKANIDEEYRKMREANPNGKATYEYSDIKAKVYGDTGIVRYSQKTTSSGFSDPKGNIELEMSVVDTWQRIAGKWKVLVTANVSRHAIPADKY